VIAFLDTSVLVRYLTGEPPDQAERASALIEADQELRVPVIAVAETAYVLSSVYGVERARVVDVLIDLLARVNITTHELSRERVAEALGLCRHSRRTSFADALIWAAAFTVDAEVFTFDQRFPSSLITRRPLA
jgi:predicted nucleic acid-binding protein